MDFTYHEIHPFKVNSSVVFVCSQRYSPIIIVNLRTFLFSPKEKLHTLDITSPQTSHPPSPLSLRYPPIYFPSPWVSPFWTSYEWNHIVYSLLWLVSFIWHDVFKIYPCCSTYNYFILLLPNISLYRCTTFSLLTHQMVDIVISIWAHYAAMNTHAQVFV